MIRCGISDDINAIAELDEAGFDSREKWSPEVWAAELHAAGRFTLVWADRDDRVMAVALFQVIAEVADLNRIIVARQYRGMGVASELLQAGIAEAVRRGANRMLLEVKDGNEAALTLYENFGFQEIADRPNYYGQGQNAIVMELNLDSTVLDANVEPCGRVDVA